MKQSSSTLYSSNTGAFSRWRNKIIAALAALAVIILGYVFIISKAAGPFVSIDPSAVTLSGNASVTTASDGTKAINFNAPATPPGDGNPAFSTDAGRGIPDTLYGVTTEEVSSLTALNDSLSRHTKRPITRIVFQSGTSPADYTNAVSTLRNRSYIMGEILDSSSMKQISVSGYKTRAANFVSAFKNNVDIWEIGNELNGEWLGTPADINAKTQAAYDVVEKDNAALNLRSAITLNYWPSSDCYSQPWEDTASFANQLPAEVKNGVDYVFLSFYETACSPRAHPTTTDFTNIFNRLKVTFPNAKIGMGEIGAQGKADGLSSDPTLTEKQQIANTYYGMHNTLKANLGSRYVGGYFWWYYFQDAVPYNKTDSMWPTIERLFGQY